MLMFMIKVENLCFKISIIYICEKKNPKCFQNYHWDFLIGFYRKRSLYIL